MKFKYQKELEYFAAQGAKYPQLFVPNQKDAYRFAFAEDWSRSFIPPHKLHPNRLKPQIEKGQVELDGFALSNLETLDKANAFYSYLKKICKNARKQIGDSISYGIINIENGMVTSADSKGHFDLYESETCDLSTSFKIIKTL